MNFSVVILAGGQSRRMGRDKAWLPVGGQPLLARQIETARQLETREIFISGRADTDYSSLPYPVLLDQFANAGPLAGIARALEAATTPLVLVLAVDLPNLSAQFLRRLAAHCGEGSGAVPRLHGFLEPLVAFYPKRASALARTQLLNSHHAVRSFAECCIQTGLAHIHEVDPADADVFLNWNTPAPFSNSSSSQ